MAAAGGADINVDPLRLEAISLQAFGAFSANERIPIGGRNLVVYGENGAGKSSIYRALRDLFARVPSDKMIERNEHVHDLDPDLVPQVAVEFNRGDPIIWKKGKHPGSPPADPRLGTARLRSAFLDYHSLLQTNAIHGTKRPNLFELAIEVLLHDYATEAGGNTVAERWRDVENKKPWRHFRDGSHMPPVESACAIFNSTLDAAVEKLTPKINELLSDLGQNGLTISHFSRGTVQYQNEFLKAKRIFKGRTLHPNVEFRGHQPKAPQHFLNEARLSALALAIYLAARLTCVPQDASQHLKLLVLDDVLVGLDYGNRRPLMAMLEKHFPDWQIVLLTHDRHWFEIIRAAIPAEKWTCHELYEMVAVSGQATPFLRPVAQSVVIATLDQADGFVIQKHLPAAANYARSACEIFFRKYCESHKLKFPYAADPKKKVTFDKLRAEIATHVAADAAKKAAMKKLEPFQQRILNPLSHDPTTSLNEAEVVAAIKAVRAMVDALK